VWGVLWLSHISFFYTRLYTTSTLKVNVLVTRITQWRALMENPEVGQHGQWLPGPKIQLRAFYLQELQYMPLELLYLLAKYLHTMGHTMGQNCIMWRWLIRIVAHTLLPGQHWICHSFFVIVYFLTCRIVWFWGITKQIMIGVLIIIENYFPSVRKMLPLILGNIFQTLGQKFSMMTLTPVAICIMSLVLCCMQWGQF